MKSRKTRQKEVIFNTLCQDDTHPTMLVLYQKVLTKDPSIGQATVYRNVNRLVKEGKIKRISTKNDVDHYDANMDDHYHITCKKCGQLKDIEDENIPAFLDQIKHDHDIEIDHYQVLFEGVCKDCRNKR